MADTTGSTPSVISRLAEAYHPNRMSPLRKHDAGFMFAADSVKKQFDVNNEEDEQKQDAVRNSLLGEGAFWENVIIDSKDGLHTQDLPDGFRDFLKPYLVQGSLVSILSTAFQEHMRSKFGDQARPYLKEPKAFDTGSLQQADTRHFHYLYISENKKEVVWEMRMQIMSLSRADKEPEKLVEKRECGRPHATITARFMFTEDSNGNWEREKDYHAKVVHHGKGELKNYLSGKSFLNTLALVYKRMTQKLKDTMGFKASARKGITHWRAIPAEDMIHRQVLKELKDLQEKIDTMKMQMPKLDISQPLSQPCENIFQYRDAQVQNYRKNYDAFHEAIVDKAKAIQEIIDSKGDRSLASAVYIDKERGALEKMLATVGLLPTTTRYQDILKKTGPANAC